MNNNAAPSAPSSMRLNRYLARCGLGSRRSVEELIGAGRILVNGVKVTELGTVVDPSSDRVEYRGSELRPVRPLEYFAYYKPRGPICTRVDPEGRETIYDALRSSVGVSYNHLNYVGRLDAESEGLLILTNDGDLVHALTHPRFHMRKIYNVNVSRALTLDETGQLLNGVESQVQLLRAKKVQPLRRAEDGHWYEVHLTEGKKRQIRRMFETIGCSVLRLIRVQVASLHLGSLKPGEVRPLTEHEVTTLKGIGFGKTD